MTRVFARCALAICLGSVLVVCALAQGDKPPAGGHTPANSAKPAPAAVEQSKAQTPVEKALASQADFDFAETPLSEAASAIARKYGINVLLDTSVLKDEAGITPETPIHSRVKNISLRSALQLMLGEKDMYYLAVNDNTLLLTTDAKAKRHIVTRVYDVSGLQPPTPEPQTISAASTKENEDLIYVVTSTVSPTTWTDNGGDGAIASCGAAIVVSQTPEVHEQISELISMLRELKADPNWVDTHHSAALMPPRSAAAKIEGALARKMDFNFEAPLPLKDLRDWIEGEAKINVALDLRAISEAMVTPDTPLGPFKAKQIALGDGLRQMLEQPNLAFVIDHESLLITTNAICSMGMVTRLYPLGDLADDADADSQLRFQEKLMETITSSVDPTTWQATGGNGSVMVSPIGCALIISQGPDTHEKIAKVLTDLRALKANHAKKEVKPAADAEPVTRIYIIRPRQAAAPTPAKAKGTEKKADRAENAESSAPESTPVVRDSDLDDYIATIRGTIAPETWAQAAGNPPQPKYFIGKAAGRIIVRQTPDVQAKIVKLLVALGALPEDTGGSFCCE